MGMFALAAGIRKLMDVGKYSPLLDDSSTSRKWVGAKHVFVWLNKRLDL